LFLSAIWVELHILRAKKEKKDAERRLDAGPEPTTIQKKKKGETR